MEENKNIPLEEKEELQELEVTEEKVEEKAEEYTGKTVKTSIRYDYKTMKYFNMYNIVHRRKFPLIYCIIAFLAIAMAIYTVISGIISRNNAIAQDPTQDINLTSTYFFGAIFLAFGVYLFFQGLKFENVVDKQITAHFMNHKVAEQYIVLTEDKITLIPLNKPEEAFSYDWIQVTSIDEIPQFFYLYIGKSPLIIDKNPDMMIEGTYQELEEIINEKIKTKPYKNTKKEICKNPITYVHREFDSNDATFVENEEPQNAEENTVVEEVVIQEEKNNTEQ